MLLPLVSSAMDLAPNQKILGHYTTDDIAVGDCWGKSTFNNLVIPIATDITPDELALFQGSKIVAFRVGLATEAPVSRVFVIPVYADGTFGEEVGWPCEVNAQGWNLIELDTPYLINLPSDAKLRIGFDYKQESRTAKPISAVNVGTIYPSYCRKNGLWSNYGLNQIGNLSVQCIAENDNFPAYVIMTSALHTNKMAIVGQDQPFTIQVCNLGVGEVLAGGCTFNVAIDGNVVSTITNPFTLTDYYQEMSGSISTDNLAAGEHTLTVTAVTVNGETIEYPPTLSCTFTIYDHGFVRHMRLVEQFTSVWCTHCPKGTAMLKALSDMRGDIAWVAVHQNMSSGVDPYRTTQCDTIANMQYCDGYPEASFDRSVGMSSATSVINIISYTNAQGGANEVNDFLNSIENGPARSDVKINSTYDPETRKAVITVEGGLVPDFDTQMGADSKLTVYITEDHLFSYQTSGGDNYEHNCVLRLALGSARGVNMNRDGDYYKNEFTVDIPDAWVADNLNVVAFISRPLRYNASTDLYVDNANKRKLGEYDAPAFIPGDVDGNGIINVTDITLLINYAMNESGDINLDAADVNGDGFINVTDVTELIQIAINSAN